MPVSSTSDEIATKKPRILTNNKNEKVIIGKPMTVFEFAENHGDNFIYSKQDNPLEKNIFPATFDQPMANLFSPTLTAVFPC